MQQLIVFFAFFSLFVPQCCVALPHSNLENKNENNVCISCLHLANFFFFQGKKVIHTVVGFVVYVSKALCFKEVGGYMRALMSLGSLSQHYLISAS